MQKLRPTFFIIGAPKAGTTSLYSYLDEHPQVLMSRLKEPNYFSYSELKNQNLYYKDDSVGDEQSYLNLYTTEQPGFVKEVGEASVSYLFYPSTARHIHTFNQTAKIIVLLRNPFDRAWSHYLMDYKLNYVNDSFDDIVQKRVNGCRNTQHYQQYIELGLYYKQLKNYIDVFEKSQLFIGLYDDLKKDSQKFFNEVCDFLQIDQVKLHGHKIFNGAEMPRNNFIRSIYASDPVRRGIKNLLGEGPSRKIKTYLFKKPELHPLPQTRALLHSLFTEDLKRTEEITGLNLKAWYETT